MQYINFNGNIHHRHEPLLPVTNRGFKYGDSFFETLVMFKRQMPLLLHHFTRIDYTMEVLGMKLPKRFDIELFTNMVLDLASVNDAGENARIRLQFYRKGDGLYLPEEEETGYVISMDRTEQTRFEPGPGLMVGMRYDCFKPASMVSDLKSNNALNYIMAAQIAKAEGWDECILLNDADTVCEAIHSNVFLVKGDKLITPHIESGCVNGVMRACLSSLFTADTCEEREVNLEELLQADEILLTNAVRGIQWVRQFQGNTYGNAKATELTALLNDTLLNA